MMITKVGRIMSPSSRLSQNAAPDNPATTVTGSTQRKFTRVRTSTTARNAAAGKSMLSAACQLSRMS